MVLKVIQSSSRGNSYCLIADNGEILVIEAGMQLAKVKEAIDFKVASITGLLVSHSHQDHSKYIRDFLNAGIEVYSSEECFNDLGITHYRTHPMMEKKVYSIGSFKVMAFPLVHDVKNFGYLISHPESGKIAFVTDTGYCPFTFKGLNNLLLEANHDIDLVDEKLLQGHGNVYVRNRSLSGHMEFQATLGFLKANDLSAVNNIVLIHLSDNGSDAGRFVSEIKELTGKNVEIAVPGLEIDFNKHPF